MAGAAAAVVVADGRTSRAEGAVLVGLYVLLVVVVWARADLFGPPAQRRRVEVAEIGLQGAFDLIQDAGRDGGEVEVVVERA